MASKKKSEAVQKRVAERKAFVAARPDLSKSEARKRFFVQTRAQELQAAGKEVNRQALRQKFESGQVKREGFLTPQDMQRASARRSVSTSASSAPIPAPSITGRVPSEMKRTIAATTSKPMMDVRRQAISGFKTNSVQSSKPNKDIVSSALDKGSSIVGSIFGRKGAIQNIGRSTGKMLSDYSNSLARTFTNPWINAGGRAVGKNPNLPTAGAKEAAITTAFTVADIATLKSASAGREAISQAIKSSKLGSAAIRGVESSRTVRGVTATARGVKKLPQVAKNEIGLWRKTENAVAAASNTRTVAGAAKSGTKPGQIGAAKISTPKPVKAPVKKTPAKKAPTVAKAPAKKAPAKKASAKKAAPVKATTKKAQQRPVLKVSQTQDVTKDINSIFSAITDTIKSTGKDISRGQTGKAMRENAARNVAKSTAKKSAAKAKTLPKVSEPVKPPARLQTQKISTGRTSTSAGRAKQAPVMEGTPTFKTQADYNKFMDTGGKYKIQQMSNEARESFLRQNINFVNSRGIAKGQQATARASKQLRRARAAQRRNLMMEQRRQRLGEAEFKKRYGSVD